MVINFILLFWIDVGAYLLLMAMKSKNQVGSINDMEKIFKWIDGLDNVRSMKWMANQINEYELCNQFLCVSTDLNSRATQSYWGSIGSFYTRFKFDQPANINVELIFFGSLFDTCSSFYFIYRGHLLQLLVISCISSKQHKRKWMKPVSTANSWHMYSIFK